MVSGSRRVYYQTMMKYGDGDGDGALMTGYQVVTGLTSEELGKKVIAAIEDGWTLSPDAHIVIEPIPREVLDIAE